MKTSYVVTWGSATVDDRGNVSAFCGLAGICDTMEDAVKLARAEADTAVKGWLDYIYDEDDREKAEMPNVYETPDGFEVDFPSDPPSQLYVRIEER